MQTNIFKKRALFVTSFFLVSFLFQGEAWALKDAHTSMDQEALISAFSKLADKARAVVERSKQKTTPVIENKKTSPLIVEADKQTTTPEPNKQNLPLHAEQKQGTKNSPKEKPIVENKKETKQTSPEQKEINTLQQNYTELLGITSPKLPLNLKTGTGVEPTVMDFVRMEEAVAFALKNNFEVKAADAQQETTTWEKWGAYGEMLPSVDINYAIGQETSMPGAYNDDSGRRVAKTTHLRVDKSINIKQPLVNISIINDILKSHKKEDVADLAVLEVKEDVVLATINVYLRLVQARLSIVLADTYKTKLQNLADVMRARLEGGAATQADLERILSRVSLAEAARIEFLGDYGINVAEFKRLTKMVPTGIEIPKNLVPNVPETVETALTEALRDNTSYKITCSQIDLAKVDRNRAFSSLLPTMAFQYSRIYTYNGGGAAEGNPIDHLSPTQDDERAMFVASWSLNGGTQVASGLAGNTKIKELVFKAHDARARIEQAMDTGYDALSAARKRMTFLSEMVRSESRVVQDFETQFIQGGRSLFELLDAHERLHQARLTLMRTLISESQAAYQVRHQMGGLGSFVVQMATSNPEGHI